MVAEGLWLTPRELRVSLLDLLLLSALSFPWLSGSFHCGRGAMSLPMAHSCSGGKALARLVEDVGSGGSEDVEQEGVRQYWAVTESHVSCHLTSRSGEIMMLSLPTCKVLKQSPVENNLCKKSFFFVYPSYLATMSVFWSIFFQ